AALLIASAESHRADARPSSECSVPDSEDGGGEKLDYVREELSQAPPSSPLSPERFSTSSPFQLGLPADAKPPLWRSDGSFSVLRGRGLAPPGGFQPPLRC